MSKNHLASIFKLFLDSRNRGGSSHDDESEERAIARQRSPARAGGACSTGCQTMTQDPNHGAENHSRPTRYEPRAGLFLVLWVFLFAPRATVEGAQVPRNRGEKLLPARHSQSRGFALKKSHNLSRTVENSRRESRPRERVSQFSNLRFYETNPIWFTARNRSRGGNFGQFDRKRACRGASESIKRTQFHGFANDIFGNG